MRRTTTNNQCSELATRSRGYLSLSCLTSMDGPGAPFSLFLEVAIGETAPSRLLATSPSLSHTDLSPSSLPPTPSCETRVHHASGIPQVTIGTKPIAMWVPHPKAKTICNSDPAHGSKVFSAKKQNANGENKNKSHAATTLQNHKYKSEAPLKTKDTILLRHSRRKEKRDLF